MIQIKSFPTLFGKDKNDKTKEWNIRVENHRNQSIIVTSYGYVNGKKTESRVVVEVGKNIGRRNETTHYEQAILNAESKWKRKRDTDGYQASNNTEPPPTTQTKTQNKNENEINNINQHKEKTIVLVLPVLPMLAQEFKKQVNKIVYPCYMQPKLDGYRMIFGLKNLKCTSRTGKEYTILYETGLYQDLIVLSKQMEESVSLDGELYVHDCHFNFESYGILRKQKGLSDEEQQQLAKIEYHIYDIIDTNKTFEQRLRILESLESVAAKVSNKIKLVPTVKCDNREEIDAHHQAFVADNYEGSMIRNAQGMYRPKYRSVDLLKYKDFDDDEFKIVDFTCETDTKGKNEHLIVWICETNSGARFKVQSKGAREARQELYRNAKKFIGNTLWVQYFGLTAEGIPRFPKTKTGALESIREEKY
jgi:ATP-dependent DNA ligase